MIHIATIFAWLIRIAAIASVLAIFKALNTAFFTSPAPFEWAQPWELLYTGEAVLFALIAVLLWELSSLLLTARNEPFTRANAKRLARMSWISLLWQIVYIAIAFRPMTINLVNIEGFRMTAVQGSTVPMSGLILVVALFALAQIFRRGAAMRQDLEGTV